MQEELNHWIYHDHDHQQMHYIQLNLVNNKEGEGDLINKEKRLINKELEVIQTMIEF